MKNIKILFKCINKLINKYNKIKLKFNDNKKLIYIKRISEN